MISIIKVEESDFNISPNDRNILIIEEFIFSLEKEKFIITK